MKPEDSFNLERIADALEGILLERLEFIPEATHIAEKIVERIGDDGE